jgi:hypothetical protein
MLMYELGLIPNWMWLVLLWTVLSVSVGILVGRWLRLLHDS